MSGPFRRFQRTPINVPHSRAKLIADANRWDEECTGLLSDLDNGNLEAVREKITLMHKSGRDEFTRQIAAARS